ncbi:hypothetical protein P691DRAFT_781141, partial [Macrolepiota fuliginosa MF-IS2]
IVCNVAGSEDKGGMAAGGSKEWRDGIRQPLILSCDFPKARNACQDDEDEGRMVAGWWWGCGGWWWMVAGWHPAPPTTQLRACTCKTRSIGMRHVNEFVYTCKKRKKEWVGDLV